ncbi:MAG TPA: hypothetical protein ENK06_06215 [Gammaproteobacteria bacterium]|nr:hypothetical protein [Gammaproteobacteria bacterium]
MNYRLLSHFLLALLLINTAIAKPGETSCTCADGATLHEIDDLLACYNDPRCEQQKLDLTVALRVKGRSLAEAIKSYLSLSNNANLNLEQRKIYLNKIQHDRKRLLKIKKTIFFSGYDDLIEPLYLDFDSLAKRYYRHYNSFNIGYEYVGLDKIFQKGLPRIGFLHYRRFGEAPASREGLGYYGIHAFGNMQLTSSAEQATTPTDGDIQNTLVVSASVFVPFFHSMINLDRSLSDLTGILITYGAKKNSKLDRINSRIYMGFRNAFNPETYIDVLYGQTQGLSTSRIEVRAHLPVYKFEHGSRIFFGGTLNMSVPWAPAVQDPDVIRFYLEWNADFGKIIEGVKSAFGV